jgi:hypothetical protein
VRHVLPVPTRAEALADGSHACPNAVEPSDHFLIGATLALP